MTQIEAYEKAQCQATAWLVTIQDCLDAHRMQVETDLRPGHVRDILRIISLLRTIEEEFPWYRRQS